MFARSNATSPYGISLKRLISVDHTHAIIIISNLFPPYKIKNCNNFLIINKSFEIFHIQPPPPQKKKGTELAKRHWSTPAAAQALYMLN
jgi:hypothetical protein